MSPVIFLRRRKAKKLASLEHIIRQKGKGANRPWKALFILGRQKKILSSGGWGKTKL